MKKNKKPIYTIQSLHFEDFKGIKKLELKNLPDNAPWIFLTGENGFGKTSILQGIAASLAGWENLLFEYFSVGRSPLLKIILNEGKIFEINQQVRKENIHFNKLIRSNFNNIASYGSSRLDTYTESSKLDYSNIKNLFDSQTLLENVEYQLTRWYSKRDDEEFNEKYLKTKQLLIDLLQIKDIRIDFKTDQVLSLIHI